MPEPSHQHLNDALDARDVPLVEKALDVVILDPPALWRALERGIDAASLAGLATAARASVQSAHAFDRLVTLTAAIASPPHRWHPSGVRALAAVLGHSEASSRYVAARPAIALPLVRGEFVDRPKPLSVMRDELRRRRAAARDGVALEALATRYRVREWVRIMARDLAGLGDVDVILEELSDLADSVIDLLCRSHLRRERTERGPRLERTDQEPRPAGFAVIAQGKLGGRELNASSDVDLQFLYSTDRVASALSSPAAGCEAAAKSLHERFSDVAQRLSASLGRRTEHGFCYRVDLNLRPEGPKGPVANSIAGAERYYETWGQTWERLALMRARRVAGSQWVAAPFLGMVRPFSYPRSLDLHAIQEMRALKARLHEESKAQSLRGRNQATVDIKRDPGLIREIELFVQILQHLHGGHDPHLRCAPLLAAVERLHFGGLLGIEERDSLTTGYAFLRRLENRIQARQERQTHALPADDDEVCLLGRSLGLASKTAAAPEATARLRAAIAQHRQEVLAVTLPLFGEPAERLEPNRPAEALASRGTDQVDLLGQLGFAEPREAQGLLEVLASRIDGPLSRRAREHDRALAAPLLADIAASPDPDQALRLFVDLDPQLRRQPGFYALLGQAPTLRRRLFDLLGTSEFLGRAIIHYPDLIDYLTTARDPDTLGQRNLESMLAEVTQRLGRLDDTELKLRSLRRFKLQEQLRIGMLELADIVSLEASLRQQSDVAEACLRACLDIARADLASRLGSRCDVGFTVLGLGRLGAREMTFGSDLDILFVYDDQRPDAAEMRDAVRLAQRLIQMLTYRFAEGPLYAIDTRLRPSGAQGPLVSTAAGFVDYHRQRAMLWERQALLRARPVCGDLGLGERLLRELADVRYPASLPPDAADQIRRLRQRMEEEIAREGRGQSNVKLGRGGLVDVEFLVQYLVLRHGADRSELRVEGTLAALRALEGAGVLPPRAARSLRDAYGFLRNLESRLRIVHNRPLDSFDPRGPSLQKLARRMGGTSQGVRNGERLLRDYQRTTEGVRRLYEELLRD